MSNFQKTRRMLLAVTLFFLVWTSQAQPLLTWTENPEVDVAGYQVYITDSTTAYPAIDLGLATSHFLTNLEPQTTYWVYVISYNWDGHQSDPSEVIQISPTPECQSVLSSYQAFLSPWPQNGRFRITAPTACAWTASSDQPWVIVTSATNSFGMADITYRVLRNENGVTRVGHITVMGHTFTITQGHTGTGPYLTGSLPSNLLILEGGDLFLNVLATDESELRYQWFRYGNEIPGATNDTYTVSDITGAAVGLYTVEVSTAMRSVLGGPTEVNIYSKPTINPDGQPQSLIISKGRPAFLIVLASGPDLQYEWRKDGNLLQKTTRLLYFPAVEESDYGAYQVTIFNQAGTTQSAIAYLSPPNENQIQGRIQIEHDANTISVLANGLPRDIYEIQISVDLDEWLPAGNFTADADGKFTIEVPNLGSNRWFIRTLRR